MTELQSPPAPFSATVALLDLNAEGTQLMAEAGDNASRRAARTLSKNDAFSVVLMAVLTGTDIRDHSVHGAAVVQLIKGQAHFEIGETSVVVGLGNAIAIAPGVEHRLSAPEDALLLLTIASA